MIPSLKLTQLAPENGWLEDLVPFLGQKVYCSGAVAVSITGMSMEVSKLGYNLFRGLTNNLLILGLQSSY